MGASPMPYALCPMPYALCPMPYEYLMLLIKAIVFGVDGWKKPPLPSRKLYKNQPIPHDITIQNEWKRQFKIFHSFSIFTLSAQPKSSAPQPSNLCRECRNIDR